MTGPVPDLAALREWVDLYLDPARSPARPTTLSWPVVELAAVLSLVDDLRAENERLDRLWTEEIARCEKAREDYRNALDENERLRKYARHLPGCRMERVFGPSECSCGLNAALAGPPAANEITSAPWRGLEGWNVGVEFRGDDVVVMARAPGQSVWRDLLTVTR